MTLYTLDTSGALQAAVTSSSAEISTTLADRLYELVSTTNAYVKQGTAYLITCLAKADLVDAEKLIVTSRGKVNTYELDVNGTGVASGNLQVDVSGETAVAEVADKIAVTLALYNPELSITHNHAAQVIADDTFTAAGAVLTANAHGLLTGDGPVRVSSDNTLPAGLAAATDYYVVRLDADTFSLATSRANAYAGSVVTTTDAGTGTHTLSDTASTTRSAGTITVIAMDRTFTIQETVANVSFTAAVAAVTAVSTGGSAVLAAGVPRIVNGADGASLAIVRVSADGVVSLTPIKRV